MLRNWEQHTEYQKKLMMHLVVMHPIQKNRLIQHSKSISKLYLLNLDSLLPVIKPLYSGLGRPAKNQQGIIRSLVLMLDFKEHSITNWAKTVANDPFLFNLCGFDSKTAPGASSYYDFLIRLWQSDRSVHVKRKLHPKKFLSRPGKKLKANEKLPPKHSGSVKKLVQRVINGRLPNINPAKIMQQLLARCVVDQSAEMGILGKATALSVAFDGSPYYSGASQYGVKVCDCRSKGIYNCTCPRRYSDPDARWGWDSYRERWFFGDTLFNVTASDSPYDLPIYLRMAQASRHDSITTVFALKDIHSLYPDFKFKNFLADGAMDSYSIYELLDSYDMIPFIPLDSRTKSVMKSVHPDVVCFDNKGRPVCKGGIPYSNWGYSKPKGIKYRCWFACRGEDPPPGCKCSQSAYGKTIYIKPKDDRRLFTPVPRHTDAFKEEFKKRTSVERSNKRMFIDYAIEDARSQSTMMRFAFATFSVINLHLDAWVKHKDFNILKLLQKAS